MKSVAVIFFGLVQLVGCSVGKPQDEEVAKIEAITTRDTCVGTLSRWHRVFYFQRAVGGVNKAQIHVTYTGAGHRGRQPGRYIVEPPTVIDHDDAQFPFAGGTYDRRTGRFIDWTCGCNVASRDPSDSSQNCWALAD